MCCFDILVFSSLQVSLRSLLLFTKLGNACKSCWNHGQSSVQLKMLQTLKVYKMFLPLKFEYLWNLLHPIIVRWVYKYGRQSLFWSLLATLALHVGTELCQQLCYGLRVILLELHLLVISYGLVFYFPHSYTYAYLHVSIVCIFLKKYPPSLHYLYLLFICQDCYYVGKRCSALGNWYLYKWFRSCGW